LLEEELRDLGFTGNWLWHGRESSRNR
jgi:hypothetical protein